ncbi:MAG: hypothetical protein JXP73_11120 [Deltaproteobacteria bacterium]|jgi:hypothetical protein|nr:hypothetical protein [Deltaproteobacteria bacterium]
MVEAAVACGLLLYLLLLALPSIELQVVTGVAVTLVGLVGGGGAGLIYHLALRSALLRLGARTEGWLWSPVSRHGELDEQARRKVLPWFRLGAAGFFACMAGIGMIVVAVLRAALTG